MGLESISELFSPHARGSTAPRFLGCREKAVFPACAGIDLGEATEYLLGGRFPRMRGDRPITYAETLADLEFPPHARGSSLDTPAQLAPGHVSPACAGIE